MKIIVMAALACISIISCKKSSMEGQQLVAGNWELTQSSGGIAGTINYEPGNGNIYTFGAGKTYRFTYNGAPIATGTDEITESAHYGHWLLRLQYVLNNQAVTEKDSTRFDAGKLIFIPALYCCDIPTICYGRLR